MKELVDSEINKTIKFMMELAKDPELMKKFEEFRKKCKSCTKKKRLYLKN